MARDCRQKLRIARLERELNAIQKALPTLPENERAQETQRMLLLMEQQKKLK